jgi:hypothetical protein
MPRSNYQGSEDAGRQDMSKVFVGIDPGHGSPAGGLGILDSQRGYLGAWRWNHKDPVYLYNKLLLYRELIGVVYLEMVRVFPKETKGFISQGQGLLVNSGIWQGWLLSLGLPFIQVDPNSWQSAQGLLYWQKKRDKDPRQHSPLTLARSWWPSAPLEFQADSGKAVGLLLADLACRDLQSGLDRGALQAATAAKAQTKKKALRQARKAAKAFLG